METQNLPPLTKSQERALIVGLILLGWALVVVFRLFLLQVFEHDEYVRAAHRQQQQVEAMQAQRGSIFDRNGTLLAISSASNIVFVNPSRIPNKDIAAALVARILHMDAPRLQRSLEAAAKSKRHSGYLIIDNNVTDQQAAGLKGMNLDWLGIQQGSVRRYSGKCVAAHVIGGVNGNGVGVSGVELKLNRELAGTPGSRRIERDGKETSYEAEIVKAPVPGRNVGLTIDSELSLVAQEALQKAVVENHAEHGSLVALNPKTGEILALENYPTYDLNERLLPGETPKGRTNLAVVAPFEPGSVFKVVTVSAAMETTSLTPDSVINCGNGVMKLFSRIIHDSHPYSELSVSDVLAKSSNIGAIRIGMQVGNQNLYQYVRRFGFGTRTGVELPAEAPGLVRPLKRWQPTSIGSVPMGHEISVTSLQLAQMGSVIANGGYLVHPHVLAWKQTPGGPREEVARVPPQQILQPHTIELMRAMMRKVVLPGGTAHQLHIPGYAIAGKTGTAQIYDYTHHVYTHRYNASFMGFAPYDNPTILVVVTISGTTGQAGFGGYAAGPVFVRVMQKALQRLSVPRDQPAEIDELIAKEKASNGDKNQVSEQDDVTLAEADGPLTAEEIKEAQGPEAGLSGATADSDPDAPKVPNFVGKTVKDVMQEATADGLEVVMLGSGLARTQTPQPGASLMPGERIRVRFAR
jgi:cell division protein FtsI (penicillin-binding protein 3)